MRRFVATLDNEVDAARARRRFEAVGYVAGAVGRVAVAYAPLRARPVVESILRDASSKYILSVELPRKRSR